MVNITSNTSPTISLVSSGSTAVPEVVTAVETCTVIPFPPPWFLRPSVEVGTGQAGHTLLFC